MAGPYDQTVKQSVNQSEVVSFTVTTSDATSTSVLTSSNIEAWGHTTIHAIHLKCTGDKCFLGLGKDASTTHGRNIIPVWKDQYFDFPNCSHNSLSVIRNGSTNVTVEGWVAIR